MRTEGVSQLAAGLTNSRTSALPVTKLPRQSRDAPLLAQLLELHAVANPRIVDCTYGRGAIWGRLPARRRIIKVDINADLPGLDVVADWLDLGQHFAPGSIDVLVWDPIHVADAGRTSQLYDRYVAPAHAVKGATGVAGLFPGFLDVAAQVVKHRTGIVLVKLADQVHAQRQQWQAFTFVPEAQARGWTACDYTIVIRPTPTPDPKHKHAYHLRKAHSFWIVLRHGPSCRGPGKRLQYEFTCHVCGKTFLARRADATTCSPRCRKRRSRAPA